MNKIKIYNAAALFNGRENLFNVMLDLRLNELGYETFLSQKDGFEFSKLNEALRGMLSPDEIDIATSDIIYLWDMGFNLPKCDVVLANMDEPLDPGVDIEQTYGRLMGKFVIGFRTDVRSPYGDIEDKWGGMHFFPGRQCDVFLKHDMFCKDEKEALKKLDELAKKIHKIIQENEIKINNKISIENPVVAKAIERADKLFSGISDVCSEQGLIEISKRYSEDPTYYSIGPVKFGF